MCLNWQFKLTLLTPICIMLNSPCSGILNITQRQNL